MCSAVVVVNKSLFMDNIYTEALSLELPLIAVATRTYNTTSACIVYYLHLRMHCLKSLHNSLLVIALSVLGAPLAGSISLDISQTLAAVVTLNILNILERDSGNKAR
jgi:hypothetical protein